MNLEALGREAGASLMKMMEGRALKGVRRLPCSLVIRDSCGAHAGAAPKGENNHE
jgi:LacI family transcriptional regulator